MKRDDPKPPPDTVYDDPSAPKVPSREPKPTDTPLIAVPPTNPAPHEPVTIRRQIGRYSVLKELGRGGMGVVYLAHQDDLNRQVALKVITAGPDADPTELARFYVEAETAANLHHPNIVQVYEVGQAEHVAYLAMEYIGGGNLYRRIGKQPMPIREAAAFLEPVARAMHYAHTHGVIHRDLKPSNILLEEPEPSSQTTPRDDSRPVPGVNLPTPKIADFGLAKRLDRPMNLTHSGVAIGTPHYMAPEQARGDTAKIGPLTDVYALGTILYEMLIGYPPFNGANSLETMDYVVHRKPVPPSKLRNGVPPELEAICLKCLEKRPHDRYPNAEALADALKVFLTGEVISTVQEVPSVPLAPTPPSRVLPLFMGALLATPIVALATWFAAQMREPLADPLPLPPPDQTKPLKEEIAKLIAERRQQRFQQTAIALEQGPWRSHIDAMQAIIKEEEAGQKEGEATPLAQQVKRLVQAWQPYLLNSSPAVQHPKATLVVPHPTFERFATIGGNTVKFWDAHTQKQIGRDLEADGLITAAAFNPTGDSFAVGTVQRTAFVWRTATQDRLGKTIEWNTGGSPTLLQFTADGRSLRIGIENEALRTFRVDDGTPFGEPVKLDQARPWKHWATHSTGFTVAADDVGGLYVWNNDQPQAAFAQPSSVGSIAGLQIAPDGRHWLALTGQGSLKQYSRDDGRWQEFPSTGHVSAYTYSADGNLIALGHTSGRVQLWDAVARQPFSEAIYLNAPIRHVALQQGRMLAITAQGECHALTYTAQPFATPPMWLENKPGKEVLNLMFAPEGTHLYVTSPYGISRWKVRDGVRLENDRDFLAEKLLVSPTKSPRDVVKFRIGTVVPAHDREPETLFVGAGAGRWFLLDATKEGSRANGQVPDGEDVTAVASSREGHTTSASVRLGERRSTLTYWSQGTGVNRGRSHTFDFVVLHEVFSLNAREIILGGSDGNVRRLDIIKDVLVGEPLNCGSPVLCVAINDTGDRVLAGCLDGTAHLWDLPTNKELLVLRHAAEIRGVAFAKGLVTAGADGQLRRWDEATGLPLGPAWSHGDAIVAFAHRGQLLATAARDRTIRLWRLP